MSHLLWTTAPSGAEIKIPILGICGEFESGKTLFALTIAPGKHPDGHKFASQARTCVIDIEKSSENYSGTALGFDRIDLPQVIMNNPAKKAYTSIDLYEEFRKTALGLPDGKYDVLAVDPITDIDAGLTDYVKANPEKFGLSSRQIEKTSGLLWGVVKEEWNRLLLALSTKCRTFVFTAHMRDVYVGNTPSGKREPKGKETLAKLATLYLELQRKSKKGVILSVPTGIRLKSRICDTAFDAATGVITTTELLPKVIENCTPQRIRDLIHCPETNQAEYYEDHLSGDMRLAYELEAETKRAEANAAELEIMKMRDKLIANMKPVDKPAESAQEIKPQTATQTQTTPQTTASKPAVIPPPRPQTVPAAPQQTTAQPQTVNTVMQGNDLEVLMQGNDFVAVVKSAIEDGIFTKDELKAYLAAYCGGRKVSELTEEQADALQNHINITSKILTETTLRSIPKTKLEEFAKQAKQPSFFVSSIETKQAILKTIEAIPPF